ncbi:MAG TPA: outer membrane assembly protein, partial [Cyclobacteriaceae bacterium]
VDYKLKGELTSDMIPKTETLIGGGEVQIANAQINGMKIFEEISKAARKKEMNDPHLRDLLIKSEIRNNRLFVKPFSIKLSGFNTDIEGVSEINGAIRYIVQIELVPIEKLRIPFHVTGTYDNPKVAIGRGHKLPE